MNARVIFSKKTREELEKPLSKKEQGRLRWEKIVEAEKSGALSMCRFRADVARLAGYTKNKDLKNGGAGYAWVAAKIKEKYLSEVVVGGTDARPECQYFINSHPNYLPFAGRYGENSKRVKNGKRVKPGCKSQPSEKPVEKVAKREAPRERGKRYWAKLEELESKGALYGISREQFGALIRPENPKQGYYYITNLVRRGFVKEEILGTNGLCNFSAQRKPNFDYRKKIDGQTLDKAVEQTVEEVPQIIKPIDEPVVSDRVADNKMKLTIKTTTAMVEIENPTLDIVEKVLEGVWS